MAILRFSNAKLLVRHVWTRAYTRDAFRDTISISRPSVSEKTFSGFNKNHGNAYAHARRDHSPSLYETVIEKHMSTGGLGTLLDVGCGPGLATRALAPYFSHAIGIDPSDGMLHTARSLGGVTAASKSIRYEIATAEDLGANLLSPILDSSIDLITASNAAHWFDVPRFWAAAARVLKPGGTVALWTICGVRAHPSVPNATAIQEALDRHVDEHLKPYISPGNLLARNRYRELPLPWNLVQPVLGFNTNSVFRRDWDGDEEFLDGEPKINLDLFEKMIATWSPQTRWHQAHLDAFGTERDIVRILRRKIELLLHEANVEIGKEWLRPSVQGTLLIIKKT